VRGGKSHAILVGLLGVLARQFAVAADGGPIDADQSGGFSDATTFPDMFQDGSGLLLRESGVEEHRASSLGKTGFARGAVKHTPLLVRAIAIADREVLGVAFAEVGALGVVAKKQSEVVVHGWPSLAGENGTDLGYMLSPIFRAMVIGHQAKFRHLL
jgi:hypothetical protein